MLIYEGSSLDVFNGSACGALFLEFAIFLKGRFSIFYFPVTIPVHVLPGWGRSGMKVFSWIGDVRFSRENCVGEEKCRWQRGYIFLEWINVETGF